MQWLELTIKTASRGIEALADSLTAWGYDSFIMDDHDEFHDFLDHNKEYWDYIDEDLEKSLVGLSQIRLFIENGPEAAAEVEALKSRLSDLKRQMPDTEFGTLSVTSTSVQEEDWENNWKQFYQPIAIGNRLMVIPKWMDPGLADGRIPLLLDPGMIFGTGAHASTQMCMAALERLVQGGEHVIDLGSGSGILSICALLLGASTAVGVDIDPKAEKIAAENAALNGLGAPVFQVYTGDVSKDSALMAQLSEPTYDIVLINIVADVIIALAPTIPHFMSAHTQLICSGILDIRLPDVAAALEQANLKITETQLKDGWYCLTAVQKF